MLIQCCFGTQLFMSSVLFNLFFIFHSLTLLRNEKVTDSAVKSGNLGLFHRLLRCIAIC